MNKKIAIAASGTGGHVIPALTIAKALIQKGYQIIWIGTNHGIENKLIDDNKIIFQQISSSGIRGKKLIYKVIGIFNFIKAIYQTYKIFKLYRPNLSIGFGGYVSTSVTLVSYIMKINSYVHEANSVCGTANKINNLFSTKTFETFPDTFRKKNKIIHSGNPISPSFASIENPTSKYNKEKETHNLLIFGGSQGAKFLNENIPFALSHFPKNLSIKHIAGENNVDSVARAYKKFDLKSDVIAFSNNMNELYDWSDIVISRSGSMTVSELAASGRASILIPYKYATDNHQLKNAEYLADNNSTIILQEKISFCEELVNNLNYLFIKQIKIYQMAINVKSLFPINSTDIILQEILSNNEQHNNPSP